MKAWKTVDTDHADLIARGALLIGTLADHVALETPALASAAPPCWAFCMTEPNWRMKDSGDGPRAIFEISDVPLLSRYIMQTFAFERLSAATTSIGSCDLALEETLAYMKTREAFGREHPALQSFTNLVFFNAWNDNIIYYGKMTPAKDDFLLFAVNLDPRNGQGADFEVPLWEFGLPDEASIDAKDLVSDTRFTWQGKVQHVWRDPYERPYAIWQLNQPGEALR